ncbi:MAG: hypothetical protein R3C59_09810 [Planctomycetaceae bacterium]
MKKNVETLLMCCTIILITGCDRGGSSPGGHHGGGPSRTVASENHEWIIVVSKGLPDAMRNEVKSELQTLIAEVARKADMVHVVSAPDHRPIASLEIPDGDLRTRVRHPSAKRSLQRIGEFLNAAGEEPNHQLQIPALSATVLSLRRTEFPLRIILVGDPVYHDVRQPGWSMANGFVPTDSALQSPICPFGSGVATFPEDSEITWLTPSSTWGTDNLHQSAVTRFYQLFFRLNGGYLARITADARSAFELSGTRLNDDIAMNDDGAARMRLVSLESTRPDVEPVVNTIGYEVTAQRVIGSSDRRDSGEEESSVRDTEGASESPEDFEEDAPEDVRELLDAAEHSSDTITFAINWASVDQLCDLDMWIRDSSTSEELSFKQSETSFGKLLRDVRHSGSLSGREDLSKWEVAEISHNRLRDISLWINVYQTSQPAEGRLIVIWNSQRREVPFQFEATSGSRGGGLRIDRRYWQKFNLPALFESSSNE